VPGLLLLAAPSLVGICFVGERADSTLHSDKRQNRSPVARHAKWDLWRFSQTVSFFKGSPLKLFLPRFLQRGDKQAVRAAGSMDSDETTLIDWGETDGLPVENTWGALDDVVMGGISSSRVSATGTGPQRRLMFEGTTSRENNGGFCSFRSRLFSPPFDLSGYTGLAFTANCQDGLRYKLQLRDNTGWDSPGWSFGFNTTAGKDVEVRVPFADLIAQFRSKTIPDPAPMRLDTISSIQITLSAFEYDKEMNPFFKVGDFQLQVGPLRLYK